MELMRVSDQLFPWTKNDQEGSDVQPRATMTAEEFSVYCYIGFRIGGIGELDLNPLHVMHDLVNKRIGGVNAIIQSVLQKTQVYGWGTVLKQIDPNRPRAKSPNITIEGVEVPIQSGQHCEIITLKEYKALREEYRGIRGGPTNALWVFMAIRSHMLTYRVPGKKDIHGAVLSTKQLKAWTGLSDRTCFDYVQTLVRLKLIIKEPGKTGYPCTYALGDSPEDLEVVKKTVKDRREKMAKMFAKE